MEKFNLHTKKLLSIFLFLGITGCSIFPYGFQESTNDPATGLAITTAAVITDLVTKEPESCKNKSTTKQAECKKQVDALTQSIKKSSENN